jgi:tRNA pseudouridine55 synthase
MYSAAKYKGKRLYQLARAGIEVPRKPKTVEFFRLELLEWRLPVFTIEVECSAGTYIRSLAQDIGQIIGCGAHLRKLVRLKSEPFHIAEAVPVPAIEEAFQQDNWQHLLYSIDEVVLGWKAVILDEESERLVKNGQSIPLGLDNRSAYPEEWCRAYSADGRFLAVLRLQKEKGLWHPDKFFPG